MLITLPNAFGDAPTNMAIDAALLESIPTGLAAFRHYAWLEPATTFGYAQHYEKVVSELAQASRALGSEKLVSELASAHEPRSSYTTYTRRLTGGGIVDHRNDWTYALIIHSSLPCTSKPATLLYELIHKAIRRALKAMGTESRLAPCPKACNSPHPASRIPHSASQCFVTPAANDVLRPDGQKIAGAAMKRTRQGLLIQGSLDRGSLPGNFDFIRFQERLIQQLATVLALPIGKLEDIRPLFNSERIEKERKRFASEAWNQRR